MDDANTMIAAHCGGGGYAITREGEAMVGNTVVTEGANSVDAQTTEGSGQVQGHDSSKTVFATGSDWQVHYNCNDPRTVNMGLITRSHTTPSKFAWGADVGGGTMLLAGHDAQGVTGYQVARAGNATALVANAWAGMKLSEKFTLGGGLGISQTLGMPQWTQVYDTGAYYPQGSNDDAAALEIFATAKYALAERVAMGVRVGISDWKDVSIDGAAPFASAQLGYRFVDVGPTSGVYVSAALTSHFSSDLTSNATPALLVGFQ